MSMSPSDVISAVPSTNRKNNNAKLSFLRKIRNCLSNPKTLIAIGSSLIFIGGAIATSSLVCPVAAPALWIAAGVVGGIGGLVGTVGLALQAYKNFKNRTAKDKTPCSNLFTRPVSVSSFEHGEIEQSRLISPMVLNSFARLSSKEVKNYAANNIDRNTAYLLLGEQSEIEAYQKLCQDFCEDDRKDKSSQLLEYYFPQIYSGDNEDKMIYSLVNIDEAKNNFLRHKPMVESYKSLIQYLLDSDLVLEKIVGKAGILQVWASLSLMTHLSEDPIFHLALNTFFNSKQEPNTMAILNAQARLREERAKNV